MDLQKFAENVQLNAVKKWRQANPIRYRNTLLQYCYGITVEDYNKLLLKQKGHCALCGATTPGRCCDKNFNVDHNHLTKKIRGSTLSSNVT